MANEIITAQVHGITVYAVIVNSTGQYWRTDNHVFEAFSVGNWSHYSTTLTENDSSGVFTGNMPSAVAGAYRIIIYMQAGGSPASTDVPVDSLMLNWNGTSVQSLGSVQLDLTQTIPTSNTGQTVGDALNAARAQGFGKWVLSGTSITLYAADNSTVVHTFTLDNANNPTTRS